MVEEHNYHGESKKKPVESNGTTLLQKRVERGRERLEKKCLTRGNWLRDSTAVVRERGRRDLQEGLKLSTSSMPEEGGAADAEGGREIRKGG